MNKSNSRKIGLYLNIGLILALVIAFSSCKSKKKLTEVSTDQTMVEDEIEPPMEPAEEPEEVVENPEKRVAVYEPTLSERLENHFSSIARSMTVSGANQEINEALRLFSSGDAPVLIIFYRADGGEDYDEPTTISKYLHYLKDTRNSTAKVEEMVMDDYGRIKELVLVRK